LKNHSFDLIVLGAGSGGLAAAKRAASYGARVAIIEGDRVGGTCVIRGCVPKKLLVYGSKHVENVRNASRFGIDLNAIRINPGTLLENVRKEVDRLNKLHMDLLEKANVELIRGWGYVADLNSVGVKTSDLSSPIIFEAKNILIAVGGRPRRPNIPGASLGWVSDDVFLQKSFPEKVVVIGAGFIACEFSCILNGLGIAVTQLVRGSSLLKGFDKELSSELQESMISRGIDIQFSKQIVSVEGQIGDLSLTDNQSCHYNCGAVVFATGREPFLQGLNLESIGLKTIQNRIVVDTRNQTNIPHIFAVGDVTDRVNLTPVAIEEGRVFADNLFNQKNRSVDYEFIPKAVFSQPEIACVGLSEEEALDKYGEGNISIYKARFRPMSKMLTNSEEKCLLKLVVQSKSGLVLGCHMLGDDSAEIIQMASIAIKMGAKKSDFDKTMALHPTIAEEFVTMQ